MTIPEHVIEAARRAYVETTGYEFDDVDLEASGFGDGLNAALSAAFASLWQPIESAPRDGSFILIALRGSTLWNDPTKFVGLPAIIYQAKWSPKEHLGDEGWWCEDQGFLVAPDKPIAWAPMILPLPEESK